MREADDLDQANGLVALPLPPMREADRDTARKAGVAVPLPPHARG